MIILVTQLDNDGWTDCEIVLEVILTIFSKLIPLLVFHDVQVICGIVIEQRNKSVLAIFNVDGSWSGHHQVVQMQSGIFYELRGARERARIYFNRQTQCYHDANQRCSSYLEIDISLDLVLLRCF